MTRNYEDLLAWQKAHEFVLNVYRVTALFPDVEKFCLVSQFRRAAVSIAANIAEGYRKIGKADKLRFLNMAQGSLEECRYYILLSSDLNYINEEQRQSLHLLLYTCSRLLNSYCKGIVQNNGVCD
ncbi:MAG: four helix bundle protein [Bacteroidaceae bacterium]|nr:four helix bundle protein [Bacteroidaceae bacterium]